MIFEKGNVVFLTVLCHADINRYLIPISFYFVFSEKNLEKYKNQISLKNITFFTKHMLFIE